MTVLDKNVPVWWKGLAKEFQFDIESERDDD